MAINPTNKLVWLVKTIHQVGKISFKEIQQKFSLDIQDDNVAND